MTTDKSLTSKFTPDVRWHSFFFGFAAFAVGLSVAFYLFPSAMLLDKWEWWATETGDNPVGVVGYLYLAEDKWRWPLTQTNLLNPPAGINAFYTDLVPIAALIGKLVYGVTGHIHLYFGHWILLAYGMQAFLGWLILTQIGVNRLLALIGAALFILPSFVARAGHIGLISHWVVLLAILSYVRVVKLAGRREIVLWAVALGSVASINPYLLAMCAAIFIAGIAEAVRRQRVSASDAVVAIALLLSTSVAWAFALGIFGQGSLPQDLGFGVYSMNLLSPLMPQSSSIPGFMGVLNPTGGQYEGFNYLGAGVIAIGLIALAFYFSSLKSVVSSNPILAVILVGLTVYAVSDKLYLGQQYIVDLGYRKLPGLSTLTSVFRSSGRFFWPVGYCVLIVFIAIIARRFSRPVAAAVLLSAVLVQWVDMRPLLAVTRAGWQVKPELVDRKAFIEATKSYGEFVLYPPSACPVMSERDIIAQLQLIAAQAKLPVNAAFVNRGGPSCADAENRFSKDIAADAVTKNPLVISLKSAWSPTLLVTGATNGFTCRETVNLIVCGKNPIDPVFTRLGGEIRPIALGTQRELSAANQGAGIPYLGIGWSLADQYVRWASGPETTIAGRLEKPVCNSLTFKALVTPLSFGNYVAATAKLTLNDTEVGEISLSSPAQQLVQHTISLGGRCVDTIKLGLHFKDLKSPAELGMNPDVRKLSWLFRWFSVTGD
jgi:hypothetical protein